MRALLKWTFFALSLAALTGGGLFWITNYLQKVERIKVKDAKVGDLPLQEVLLLKEYHGAKAVKFENGRWYFLGPRGKRWYPLTTLMACKDLELSCTETAAK